MRNSIKYIIALLMILSCDSLRADELHDYHYYKLFAEEATPAKESDDEATAKFATPYFGRVINRGRGGVLNGIRIERMTRSEARRLQLSLRQVAGTTLTESGTAPYLGREYSTPALQRHNTTIKAALSTRYALGSAGATTAHSLGKGWEMVADLVANAGNDLHIKGVSTYEARLGISLLWRPDSLNSLSIVARMAPSSRASHGASSSEALRLIGNNLYNPLWGYDKGRVRNSAIRREFMPSLVASFERILSPKSRVRASLGITAGESRYSGMDYFGVTTPLPDNHRYLPSNFDNEQVASVVEAAWRNGDSRYTQINFDELRYRNRFASGALYAISERVDRRTHLQLHVAAQSQISDNMELHYGVEGDVERSRNFKQMADLLDGGRIADQDFYLVDNGTLSHSTANDLNNPTRTVGEGERFSYDYALTQSRLSLFASLRYTRSKWSVEAGAKAGYSSVVRRGFFRKAIFASNSYGRSRTLSFAPFTLHAVGSYALNERHSLCVAMNISAESDAPHNYFLQSRYNNRIIDNPGQHLLYAFEAGYRLRSGRVSLNASLFARYRANERQSRQLFDDITYEYCDFVTSGINTLHVGIEAEAGWRINKMWRLYGAALLGRHLYTDNAVVSAYRDTDNVIVADCVPAYIKGLSVGNTPQIEIRAGGSLYKRGWSAGVDVEYDALRYVAPSLTRRTMRVLNYAISPEERATLTSQERLSDIFRLNLSLSKRFYLRKYDHRIYTTTAAPRFIDRHPQSHIVVSLYVDNLLGSRNHVAYGYESSRTPRRYIADGYTIRPHANLYRYDYPRTYYLQVRFIF